VVLEIAATTQHHNDTKNTKSDKTRALPPGLELLALLLSFLKPEA